MLIFFFKLNLKNKIKKNIKPKNKTVFPTKIFNGTTKFNITPLKLKKIIQKLNFRKSLSFHQFFRLKHILKL